MDELRVRLIERLCRLPEAQLADVEAMLLSLERGSDGISLRSTTNAPAPKALAHHKDWPHAPVHRLAEQGTYIVTASTLHKEHFFRGEERLTLLENKLLFLAKQREVTLEAWAVFSNHYHFVAHTTGPKTSSATRSRGFTMIRPKRSIAAMAARGVRSG